MLSKVVGSGEYNELIIRIVHREVKGNFIANFARAVTEIPISSNKY